jgi:hypothetical protein
MYTGVDIVINIIAKRGTIKLIHKKEIRRVIAAITMRCMSHTIDYLLYINRRR